MSAAGKVRGKAKPHEFLSIDEAAELLRVNRKTL